MRNIKKIFIILTYLCAAKNIIAQQPQTEWIQRYNSPGNYNEDLVDMVLDKYGNAYLTGNTGNPSDIVTLKYNPSGNLQWARIYNGPANREDIAKRIAIDDSGFAYIAGVTFSPLTFDNYLTLKYSSEGDLIWIRESNNGDSTTDVPNDMVIDDSSNIYMTGYGYQCPFCTADYMTIKYDRNGILQWKKFYHGEGYFSNYGWTLALDKNRRVIVSGKSADVNNIYYNATVIYGSNGIFIRKIRIDTADIRRLEVDNFDNFYIGGFKKSPEPPTNTDIFINKYDSSGNLLWNKYYGSNTSLQNRNDYLSWMHLDADGKNMYLTGYGDMNNQPGWDFILIKSNIVNGDSAWKKGYTPVNNSDNQSIQLAVDKLNNVYITGSSDYNTPYYRFLTVKYDSSGNFKWSANYTNYLFANHYGKRIQIDSNYNIYVSGPSYDPQSSSSDIVLIKYSQITKVSQQLEFIADKFTLYQNYPNPFNSNTKIKYTTWAGSIVKLCVYNVLGKKLEEIENGFRDKGVYEINFDAKDLSSGIYFYSLFVNGLLIDKKKFIILK